MVVTGNIQRLMLLDEVIAVRCSSILPVSIPLVTVEPRLLLVFATCDFLLPVDVLFSGSCSSALRDYSVIFQASKAFCKEHWRLK